MTELGMSQFEMYIGLSPRAALDFVKHYESSIEMVDNSKSSLR